MKPPRLVAEALEVLRLPSVRVELEGDDRCLELYQAFTRRHHRWRVIQSHKWGAALARVPQEYDEYLAGPQRSHLRQQISRARRAGFTAGLIDAPARLAEVLEINRSAELRQGRPMHRDYFDEAIVRRYLERTADVYGVTDADGVLRGYACLRTCGSAAVVERILGHAGSVGKGIMYLLMAEAMRDLSARRTATGRPEWLYYDMFAGASPGLRQFKHWIGCEAYRVDWVWCGGSDADRPPASDPADRPEGSSTPS